MDWCWSSNTLATWCKEVTYQKRHCCWERLKAGGEGDDRGWDGWMPSLTWWTWVWASSGSWWSTEKSGVLQFRRSERARHDRDWTELKWGRTRILSQGCTIVSWLLLPCFASSLFPNYQLFESVFQDSGKVMEARVCSLQTMTWGHRHRNTSVPMSRTGCCSVSVQDTKARHW